MAKTTRLVIRLAAEDRDWIRLEAERIGVDSATLVRMLIRQARTMEHAPEGVGAIREAVGKSPGPHAASFDQEPPADELAADQDLDALMQAAPSLLDEAESFTDESEESYVPPPVYAPRAAPPAIAQGAPYRFQRAPQRQQQLQPAIPPRHGYQATPAFGAGTLTRAVGTGNGTHGNVLGDGVGNVIRDNFGHLGFSGTRSR